MILDKYTFRGISIESREWVYGNYYTENQLGNIRHIITYYERLEGDQVYIEIDPKTLGLFSTHYDKNNNPIFEGDVILSRTPGRDSQTHTGDNIPLGSYTEPLEPMIHEDEHVVEYRNGVFQIQLEDHPDCPITWSQFTWDLEDAKSQFSFGYGYENNKRLEWDDSDESDLPYLLSEYGYETEDELIESLGMVIVGNVHTDEEYKDWI